MKTLVLAEHNGSAVESATYAAIAAAALIGGVEVLVAGFGCGAAADEAARLEGVDRVLLADAPAYRDQLAENVSALVLSLMPQFDAFIAPTTSRGKGVAPRVAAILDVMQISDIVAVDAPRVFRRPIYAGNAIQTVTSDEAKLVVTVRISAFRSLGVRDGACEIVSVSQAEELGLSELIGSDIVKSDRPELASAKIIVSGGRALRDAETFARTLTPLADRLGAAIGASRAAVDAGYISNEYQVGQTGKIVAPEVYFAIGISGAIQHLAGMKESRVIIAINSDPDAPIFQVADYALVGDLFEAIPEILEHLGA
ncbi:MAG: FAD-binding protein [Candidatus Andeanibacterium colombiense]|uniref:Electron transfer flavoprotein subunit alpha n=1 Tax=Candidatus Andeanibacterium colombiense TaxID=3121345 RepID=A0AAJ5X8Z1_9SPHN|nr:MAG: FAD-binding protein [Sphingomonadaceae bacterium]